MKSTGGLSLSARRTAPPLLLQRRADVLDSAKNRELHSDKEKIYDRGVKVARRSFIFMHRNRDESGWETRAERKRVSNRSEFAQIEAFLDRL